jgi:hypothetical protein
MLTTSTDLLLVVIAFCILWLTVFICWSMYYVVMMLKNFSKMTISVREKLEIVDKILKLVHEKLEAGSNHMALITDTVIKMAGYFMDKQKSSSGKKRKR